VVPYRINVAGYVSDLPDTGKLADGGRGIPAGETNAGGDLWGVGIGGGGARVEARDVGCW